MVVDKGEITVGRFMIPYRVYGTAPRAMVCVAGAQQTMAVWRSVVSFFVKDYAVVVFDLPGLGRSKILNGPIDCPLGDQLEILRQVIEVTARPGPLTLVGASWGTIVAALYAARYADKVDKLLLASFGMKPSESMLRVIREGQQLYEDDRPSADIAKLMIDRFGQHITGVYKKMIVEQFKNMTDEHLKAFYNHCRFVENVEDIKQHVNLDKIKARTLIVNGEHDTILDLEDMEEAITQIPNCEKLVVKDAGHFLHFERADILHIYDEFLSD